MRKFLALLAGGILAVMGQANAQAIPDLPAATLPLSGNELTVLVQGGATVQSSISAFPTAAVPPIPLTLSAAPLTAPSFLDTPGSRSSWYGNNPGQRWQLAIGSAASPILTRGAAFSISEYFRVPLTECTAPYNIGCATALLIDVTGDATNEMVTSGLVIHALSSSTMAGTDVQAGNFISEVSGSSTATGMGIFVNGRRNASVGHSLGMEVSSTNNTTTNCGLGYINVGDCDGIWLSSRGLAGGVRQLSSALHVGSADGVSIWREGITVNPAGVLDTTFNDKSSSTTSISITGTHTTAINTGAGAGNVTLAGGNTTVTGGTFTISSNITPVINATTAGQQAAFRFQDATTTKWTMGKQTDNAFFLFDAANAVGAYGVSAAGDTSLGEPGRLVDLIGDTFTNSKLLRSATAPTIASGGCTTGSAQGIQNPNGTAAFTIKLGGATCGSTIVLTLPAASVGWVCDAHDITTPASNVVEQSVGGSTTSVTLTNYVRTTGVAGNFTGADVLAVKCLAY